MSNNLSNRSSANGFTLIELLVIVVALGILSAIVAPSWMAFVNTRRLNTGQDQIYRVIREAQSNAKRDKVTWQASFREIMVNGNPVVQWAVHRAGTTPTTASWQNLEPNVRLHSESNLPLSSGVRRAMFNYQGCPVSQAGHECTQTALTVQGRLTLSIQNGGKAKRCVIVSTLLGALRTAKEQPQPDNKGRYCY